MRIRQQISALKYITGQADVEDLSKKILWLLLDRSEGGTKEVALTLQEDLQGYTKEEIEDALGGFERMHSSRGTVHLHELCEAMGLGLSFSYHYGHLEDGKFNSDGQFAGCSIDAVIHEGLCREGMPLRYTFWYSVMWYSKSAEAIQISREELDAIDLSRPGLYENMEPKALSDEEEVASVSG